MRNKGPVSLHANEQYFIIILQWDDIPGKLYYSLIYAACFTVVVVVVP